jgi:hypothetical protein
MGVKQTNSQFGVGNAFFQAILVYEGNYHHRPSSHNPMASDLSEPYQDTSSTKSQSIHSSFHHSYSRTYQSCEDPGRSHFPILTGSIIQDHSAMACPERIGLSRDRLNRGVTCNGNTPTAEYVAIRSSNTHLPTINEVPDLVILPPRYISGRCHC